MCLNKDSHPSSRDNATDIVELMDICRFINGQKSGERKVFDEIPTAVHGISTLCEKATPSHYHNMKFHHLMILSSIALVSAGSTIVLAADSASDADKAFVAKVSQGGMYEVEASKVAEKQATAADVKDQATTEVHDHEGVNKRLKKIAEAAGLTVSADLNSEFAERLEKLKAVKPEDFDKAYIEDMKQIHDKDEKLFAREAEEGTGEFKAFAHETDIIVKRHIGSLHGND
jgi:putative membrane protein